ncbi:MAG TPA: FAD/NAD(P)-binding protein [Longimicrobium sp.]
MISTRNNGTNQVVLVGGGPAAVHFLAEINHRTSLGCRLDFGSVVVVDPKIRPDGGTPHSDVSRSFRVNMATSRHNIVGLPAFTAYLTQFGGAMEDPPLRTDLGGYLGFAKQRLTDELGQAGYHIEFCRAGAEALYRTSNGYEVALSDGRSLTANYVVLATGHAAPTIPPNVKTPDGAYVGVSVFDGGSAFAQHIEPHHNVLVMGTGPSGIDVARFLIDELHIAGRVDIVSRTGRLSAVQTDSPPPAALVEQVDEAVTRLSHKAPVSLSAVWQELHAILSIYSSGFDPFSLRRTPTVPLAHLAELIAHAQEGGPAWRHVVEEIGVRASDLWRLLAPAAKVEFLKEWERDYYLARHAMQLGTARWLGAQLALGRIGVGQLKSDVVVGDKVIRANVSFLPGAPVEVRYDRLVIATGPEYRVSRTKNPIIRQMLERSLAWPGTADGVELGGFETTEMQVAGLPGVFAMGALVRGEDFAVHSFPALARHARLIINQLEYYSAKATGEDQLAFLTERRGRLAGVA